MPVSHRTITWPHLTARKVKLASAFLGITAESFIASSIEQALENLAQRDPAISRILAEVAE